MTKTFFVKKAEICSKSLLEFVIKFNAKNWFLDPISFQKMYEYCIIGSKVCTKRLTFGPKSAPDAWSVRRAHRQANLESVWLHNVNFSNKVTSQSDAPWSSRLPMWQRGTPPMNYYIPIESSYWKRINVTSYQWSYTIYSVEIKHRGPNVGICSKPFHPYALNSNVHSYSHNCVIAFIDI